MPESDVLLVLCLVAAMIVLINGGLALSLLRSKTGEQIRLARTALTRARDPWREEDQGLRELRERVAGLSETRRADPPDDEG